eukprot:901595-Rhodomonas_salina.1
MHADADTLSATLTRDVVTCVAGHSAGALGPHVPAAPPQPPRCQGRVHDTRPEAPDPRPQTLDLQRHETLRSRPYALDPRPSAYPVPRTLDPEIPDPKLQTLDSPLCQIYRGHFLGTPCAVKAVELIYVAGLQGGTVQCMRTLQVENGDVLNYFEVSPVGCAGPS